MEADFFAFYQWDMIDINQVELGLKDPDQRIQTKSQSFDVCVFLHELTE